jgi:hypothetical protein
MDRRERRRRKRERQRLGLESKLGASQSHTVGMEASGRSPRIRRYFGKTISRTRLVARLLLGGIAILGGWGLFHPHVSLEPFLQPNPREPLNTLFSVTNDNSVFTVHDLISACEIKLYRTSANNLIGNSEIAARDKILTLGPKASSTVGCPSTFLRGDVTTAEIEIDISYRQEWWPLHQTERYPFTGIRDSEGTIHWTHHSLSEQH